MGHTLDTPAEPHGWLGTETLKTHAGDFAFKNGYPAGDTAQRLRDLQTLNRATEVYLTQLMPVSEIALREGLRAFGATKPTQVVIWESLMDAKTILLTANTETVYAISHLALRQRRSDGGGGAAAHAGLPPGRTAALPRRHRTAGPRQRPGRKIPGVAAWLPRQRA